MIQLKPTQLYVVRYPVNGKDAFISKEGYLSFYSKINGNSFETEIKATDFKLIGTYQSGMIDFDCECYIKESIDLPEYKYGGEVHPKETYWNYETKSYSIDSDLDSFTSLLEANQVPIRDNEKYCLLKIINI